MKYYKVLDSMGRSCFGGNAQWSLPQRNEDGTWVPGEWMPEVEGNLGLCANGYHVVTLEQLPRWLGDRIFEVEIGKEVVHDDDKSVVRTCRLTRECEGWNDRTARLFACDCAERVLPDFETKYPNDNRPRKAIETARRYANGEANEEDLLAAWAAARIAAQVPESTTIWVAAWAASQNASEAAKWVVWNITGNAIDDPEYKWQVERLKEILESEPQ